MTLRPRLLATILGLGALAACATPPRPDTQAAAGLPAGMAEIVAEAQLLGSRSPGDRSRGAVPQTPQLIDAARAVRHVHGLPYPQTEVAHASVVTIPSARGPLAARLYGPATTRDTPIVLLFAGGGWTAPNLDSSDPAARALAQRTGALVLLAAPGAVPAGPVPPEAATRFPAAHEAAIDAYRWLLMHARELGGDPTRIALGGEGAGAGLALDTALAARDLGLGGPQHLLLVTPLVGLVRTDPPQPEIPPFTFAALERDQDRYAPGSLGQDPRLNPEAKAALAGLPPTTLVLAQFDPARPGAEMLAARLTAAGVPTRQRVFAGMVPGFFGLDAVLPEAAQAQAYAAAELATAFERRAGQRPVR